MRMILTGLLLCGLAGAAESAAETAVPAYLGPNRADEPLRKEFSLAAATDFLDAAAADWWQTRGCFTCHTNYAYLQARPGLAKQTTATQVKTLCLDRPPSSHYAVWYVQIRRTRFTSPSLCR